MTLARYRAKRDFQTTSEPRGGRAKKGWLYVVQKHAARQLHYDFRLQIGGTLKSWAVPKGPSLDPKVRRLAMHVEDHPVEYGGFEGTIPAGQYGAGTVMLWDTGSWEIEGDAEEQYRQGKLHFTLHGEKLRGEWVLVRRSGASEGEGKEPWFLFKVRDDEAVEGDEDGILEREPDSAKSGRTMDEITTGKSRVWNSGRKAASSASNGSAARTKAIRAPKAAGHASRKQLLARLPGAKEAAMPTKIKPQLATLVKQAPEGDEWFSEIKFDGYRMLCRIEPKSVKFVSRNGLDWTNRLKGLDKAARGLGVGTAILDGEVVALEDDGRSSFQNLQNAFSGESNPPLIYYVFDVLYLDGTSLVKVPLEQRKQILAAIIGDAQGPIRDAGYIVGEGPQFFAEAGRRGLEGIICKRRDRPYRPGRSADWLKVKCGHREEFVIGGYTDPSGARVGFGALLLGYHNDKGELVYCGRVGTGFGDKLLADLTKRLKQLQLDESPFANLQGRTGEARGAHWVKPELVAQVAFSEWTHDRHLRHPAFQGLREDKKASEITREQALPLKKVAAEAGSGGAKSRAKKSVSASSNGSAVAADIPASVRLTHPDKVLYPEDGITKAQLAGYYARVADWILPHIEDRPLTLVRCPAGYKKQCFYQKHAEKGMPDALGRITIAEKRQKITYATVKDVEGLLSLVHMNVLEIHIWGSRTDNIERPDRLVFDLDPDEGLPWKRVIESARQLRAFFEELDLVSFVKTTGGKGLHLVLPIERRTGWDDAKEICRAIAEAVTRADPDRYTTNMSKAARGGRIFIDYLRNGRGATSIGAYSTRARAGCPVSTPISWEELATLKSASQFTLANVPDRLDKLKRDPWQDIGKVKQSLAKSLIKKLNGTG